MNTEKSNVDFQLAQVLYEKLKSLNREIIEHIESFSFEDFSKILQVAYHHAVLDNILEEREKIGRAHRSALFSLSGKKQYDIEEVRQVPFEAVLDLCGLEHKRGWLCCPFHSERTPSFKVNNENKGHCFGCGWHGDVIDFYMDYHEKSFRETVQDLLG